MCLEARNVDNKLDNRWELNYEERSENCIDGIAFNNEVFIKESSAELEKGNNLGLVILQKASGAEWFSCVN